jgi:hypothetical protein
LTYLGFLTDGKLAAIFIKPSLGVPNWPVIYFINLVASLIIGSGLAIVRPRLSDEQHRRRTLLRAERRDVTS